MGAHTYSDGHLRTMPHAAEPQRWAESCGAGGYPPLEATRRGGYPPPPLARHMRPSSAGSSRRVLADTCCASPSSARPLRATSSGRLQRGSKVGSLGSWSCAPRFENNSWVSCLNGAVTPSLRSPGGSRQQLKTLKYPVTQHKAVEGQCSQGLNTQVCGESNQCSIPGGLWRAMRSIWRDNATDGDSRYICVLECCHQCERHASTTNHDPSMYAKYTNMTKDWIESTYSFVRCVPLESHPDFCKMQRIGAFEVYLLYPGGGNGGPAHFLLHSKLVTSRWPSRGGLLTRLQVSLPDVVMGVRDLLRSDFKQSEAEAIVEEAQHWGLESYVQEKISAVSDCLEYGHQATADGDKEGLRKAVQQGAELQMAEGTIANWRDSLKNKNMVIFTLKQQARRIRRNMAIVRVVGMMRRAVVRPLKIETLQKAVDEAREVEIAEEDLSVAVALLSKITAAQRLLAGALEDHNLEDIAQGLWDAQELQLDDEVVYTAQEEVSQLASTLRQAVEVKDYTELTDELSFWSLPEEATCEAWSLPDFADILKADSMRQNLKIKVDEAERRLKEQRWKALESAVRRLEDVRVGDELWERWMTALQRERNFTTLKAMSGAGRELKRRVHTMRLEAALGAKSIPVKNLEDVAKAAEEHGVDERLVSRARGEVATVRQRFQHAQDAIAKRKTDTAEVMLWKLRTCRIKLEAHGKGEGPLWDMVSAVRDAEATRDVEAMQAAIEGWTEEKPGAEHEAFAQEHSATRVLRFARGRIKELRIIELREHLDTIAFECLGGKLAKAQAEEVKLELQKMGALMRGLAELEWEATAATKARVLASLNVARAGNHGNGASRFGAAMMRVCDGPARIVFLLDQSKSVTKPVFEAQLKPAVVAAAQGLRKHAAEDTHWGAVAYGPLKKVHELTRDFDVFKEAVEGRKFGGGERSAAKALKMARELHKLELGASTDGAQGALPVVINFMCGEPDSLPGAQKAFRLVDAMGAVVVGIGVGPAVQEGALSTISSAGLAFTVPGFPELKEFLEEALATVDHVLAEADRTQPEDILRQLDEF